ncbi:MAG: hypothetical protein AB7L13_10635 [Acidimicrobiia bacterium]
MDIVVTEEESAALQSALRTYCSDLRMEIVDTDNPGYRRDLRHERDVLQGLIDKLDRATNERSDATTVDAEPALVRIVAYWRT